MSTSVRTIRRGSALMADAVAQVVWVPATGATGANTTQSVDLAAAQSFTTIASQSETLGTTNSGGYASGSVLTRTGIISLSGAKCAAVVTATPRERAYLAVPSQIVLSLSAATAGNTGTFIISGTNQFDEDVIEQIAYAGGTATLYQTKVCYKQVEYIQVVPTATGTATDTISVGWKIVQDATGLFRIPTPFKIRSARDIVAVIPINLGGSSTSFTLGAPIASFTADPVNQSIILPNAAVTTQPTAFMQLAVVAASDAIQGG